MTEDRRAEPPFLSAEREIERLRAELAAAREAERTMHEMKERHAGDADYLLRQRNAAFAKGEEYRAKWEAGERCLADTREALKRVAVHVAIRKAERHKGEITGDDCPLCRRDQHELDLIGAALAATPAAERATPQEPSPAEVTDWQQFAADVASGDPKRLRSHLPEYMQQPAEAPQALNADDLDLDYASDALDTTITVTHRPTGLAATCGEHRSQLRNKDQALRELAAKVAEAPQAERPQVASASAEPASEPHTPVAVAHCNLHGDFYAGFHECPACAFVSRLPASTAEPDTETCPRGGTHAWMRGIRCAKCGAGRADSSSGATT